MLSCVRLCTTPWTAARQAPLSMGFSRQEYWSGLLCPPPGDFPDPGTEPKSSALQEDSLPLSHWGSSSQEYTPSLKIIVRDGCRMTRMQRESCFSFFHFPPKVQRQKKNSKIGKVIIYMRFCYIWKTKENTNVPTSRRTIISNLFPIFRILI